MNEQQIEQLVREKGLTAPRITPKHIDDAIVVTEIVKHVSPTGKVLRWAVLTVKSGFAVTGKPSCSMSKENDNAEIGEARAIENARAELWTLMVYAQEVGPALDAMEKGEGQ